MKPTTSEWHGWARQYLKGGQHSATTLHIGPLPGRKSVALYRLDGGMLRVLAYFRSTATARLARDAINFVFLNS